MKHVDTFQVVFDNSAVTFYAGQQINGKVLLNVKKKIKVKEFSITFYGYTGVFVGNAKSPEKNAKIQPLETNVYFNHVEQLLSSEDTKKQRIGKGDYQFPIKVNLPPNLPTSFEGNCGRTRYTCTAKIVLLKKGEIRCELPFTVLSVIDLNPIPNISKRASMSDKRSLGILFFKTPPVTTTVSINKTGFVPGESVVINADIDNKATKELTKVSAAVQSVITYRAQGTIKQETTDVCSIAGGAIPAETAGNWNGVQLKIPPIPPTEKAGNLINIEYQLSFTLSPAGFSNEWSIRIPIVIGTVPLRSDFASFATQDGQSVSRTSSTNRPTRPPPPRPTSVSPGASNDETKSIDGPTLVSPTAPPLYEPQNSLYPNLPPPTYEESIYGAVNISVETTNEQEEPASQEIQYLPRYVYYNQPTCPVMNDINETI